MLLRGRELVRRVDDQVRTRPVEERIELDDLEDAVLAVLASDVDPALEVAEVAVGVEPEQAVVTNSCQSSATSPADAASATARGPSDEACGATEQ